MKASESNLFKLLQAKAQFTIPIYQRTYSWTTKQCQQLWSDMLAAAIDSNHPGGHFIGSIVYIGDGGPIAKVAHLQVIDGQQRLTTVSLLLLAIRDHLRSVGDTEEISADEVHDDYLVNANAKGDDKYKIVLTQTDRTSLRAFVDGASLPEAHSIRIQDNYQFFRERLVESGIPISTIFEGFMRLFVVDVALDPKDDDPQLIFESLNSTGLALTQADLVRNYILMGLDPEEQEYIYTNYWHKMEDQFGQSNYQLHFDTFMRHYLTLRLGRIPRQGEVYAEFKKYLEPVMHFRAPRGWEGPVST